MHTTDISLAYKERNIKVKLKANKAFLQSELKRDSENRIIIDMNVKDDSDFLSVYSTGEVPVINGEVAEFIENNTASVNPKENLTLRIYSTVIDDEEKALYKKAIKSYYTEKYKANGIELKKAHIISAILLIMGIFVLALAVLADYFFESDVWPEVIDIFAWVLIWESADISIFKSNLLRTNKKRYSSFINMNVEYPED